MRGRTNDAGIERTCFDNQIGKGARPGETRADGPAAWAEPESGIPERSSPHKVTRHCAVATLPRNDG